MQAAVGQFHDDDQFAVDDSSMRSSEQTKGWRTSLMRCEGVLFLLGANAVHVEGIEVAVDELDGLVQAAGSFALPDFAEAAAAQRLDQAIAGNRLRVRLPQPTHCVVLLEMVVPVQA